MTHTYLISAMAGKLGTQVAEAVGEEVEIQEQWETVSSCLKPLFDDDTLDDSCHGSQHSNQEVSNYKTERCRYWSNSQRCPFGESCVFAHGDWERRQKNTPTNYRTKECHNFSKLGVCKYGDRCQFKHSVKGENPQPLTKTRSVKVNAILSYWQQLDILPDLIEQSLYPRRLRVFEEFSEDSFEKINWIYRKPRTYTI